jgi:hypothetical protein
VLLFIESFDQHQPVGKGKNEMTKERNGLTNLE